jgi:hypothetical protein
MDWKFCVPISCFHIPRKKQEAESRAEKLAIAGL